ncbi:hypothetical protein Tco_0077030, partial [Tanacetum coccineum]
MIQFDEDKLPAVVIIDGVKSVSGIVKYSKESDNPTNCGLAGKAYVEAKLFGFLATSVFEK